MKIKKEYAYLGGGALLLWLLSRRKSTGIDCPIPNVMQWWELAEGIAKRKKWLNEYQILAMIHAQSQGNPDQVYYIGGVWRRVGLMGVPMGWAQELDFRGDEKDLMDPATNIEWASKILFYVDVQITRAYRRAGITMNIEGTPVSHSYNAYSFWVHGEQFSDIQADSRSIDNKDTLNIIRELNQCYGKALGWFY